MGWAVAAPLLISALGTGLSMTANTEEQNSANKAAENEINLQNQFAQQGKNVFENSLSQSTPQAVQKQINQGQQTAANQYAALQSQGLPGASLNTESNPQPQQSQATENAQVGAKIGQQNAASAALQGYNASDVAQYIKDLQAKTQLGQIGTFAQQSENTLPAQLQQALQSQSTLSGIGSLLSSLGNLGGIYGAINSGGMSGVTPMSQVGNYGGTASMLNNAGLFQGSNIGDSIWNNSPYNMYGSFLR